MKDTVTILRSDLNLTKTFTFVDGKVHKSDYGNAFWYEHLEAELSDINDLSECLGWLEDISNACVIRGLLIDGVNTEQRVLRRKNAYGGHRAYYQENPAGKHWGFFDFDKVPDPVGFTNNADRLAYLVSLLGDEFKDVSYHYQWSSSAGVNGWDTLSCHLWYWLEEPRTDEEMCRWAVDNGDVDDAPFRTIQPNYTARPIFIGMDDPVGNDRSGFVRFEKDSVLVPKIEKAREVVVTKQGESFVPTKSFSQRLNDIGPRFHMPIQRAIASYISRYGTRADISELKTLIVDQIYKAPQGQNPKSVYTNDRYLDGSIEGAIRKFGGHTPNNMELMKMEIRNMGRTT